MGWWYNRIATHSGVGPGTVDKSHIVPDYEFFETTDPNVIKGLEFSKSTGLLFGPYNSLADAQAQAAKTPPESAGAAMTDLTRPPSALQIPGLDTIGSAASGVAGFLGALTDPHTWIRIAEVVLGLVLIAVGIAKLTNAVPIATRVAGGAAKIGAVAAL